MSDTYPSSEFARYMALLGISKRVPDKHLLTHIIRAHLARIPFENISKLYYRKTAGRHELMDLAQYLGGIERYHFDGTCYENNYHLHELLVYLGYDAALCGADMGEPDVHLVNLVSVKGREFIVDFGYAAPVLAGLAISSVLAVQSGSIKITSMLPLWLFYASIIPLYGVAYFLAVGMKKLSSMTASYTLEPVELSWQCHSELETLKHLRPSVCGQPGLPRCATG